MRIRNTRYIGTLLGVLILIGIEQGIKLIINSHFFNERIAIFPPFLYFEPMFNRRYSWLNSMLQIDATKWVHIAFVSVMILLIGLFYRYLNKKLGASLIVNVMFAFLFSGAMCSLVDKVFWNGSLDYILLKGFFTFDLKDVYINVFIGLLILSLLLKNKTIRKIEDEKLVGGFFGYVFGKSRS
jgi:signal peptidase II